MQDITLTADAVIANRTFREGMTVTATAEAVERGYREAARLKVRNRITAAAGDTASIVGTQADVVGIILVAVLADIVSLGEHAGNEAQRERLRMMEEVLGDDVATEAAKALQSIARGDATLTATATAKGVGAVLDEALERSTKTAAILVG